MREHTHSTGVFLWQSYPHLRINKLLSWHKLAGERNWNTCPLVVKQEERNNLQAVKVLGQAGGSRNANCVSQSWQS